MFIILSIGGVSMYLWLLLRNLRDTYLYQKIINVYILVFKSAMDLLYIVSIEHICSESNRVIPIPNMETLKL